ncbi:hypothetical protein [Lentilitoribacter sp. Alg239-R112]|uniref:hypothetical protein n=1 Tax=Lentilitoribacter sp. Alg239-R112 TaxID=2305987 RepID=UPI0013A70A7A|nr:hypothetical protein [Lentilitoribacter sp. Alg239-R112]
MKNLMSTAVGAIILAATIAPSQARELDLAIPGTNVPAWSTMDECQANRSGCQFIMNACGWDVYTTRQLGLMVARAYDEGHSVDVHTMKNGRFDEYICVYNP